MHYIFQRKGGPLLSWAHGAPAPHRSLELSGIPVGRRGGSPEPMSGIGSAIAGSALVSVLGALFVAGFAYGSGKSLARRLIEK